MVGGAGVLVARLGLLLVDHLRVLRELEADLTRANFLRLGLGLGLGLGLRFVRGGVPSNRGPS